ncbi:MAG TPA: rhomboid family intramembrane serine protease [Chthoniobacterales bacterium]
MIDLNHILLFLAVVSPLILLVRIARLRNPRNRGWLIASLIVLAVCVIAWATVPSLAGFFGGAAWICLLLFPPLAEHAIAQALIEQRLGRARGLAVVRRLFHPWDDSPYRPEVIRSLELAGKSRLGLALDQLAKERDEHTPGGHYATALTFALTENWAGLVQWYRGDLSLTTDPAVYSLYLRALGEIGLVDDLVFDFASHTPDSKADGLLNSASSFDLALVLAFSGQTEPLVRLVADRLGRMPLERQQFWLATVEWAEGKSKPAQQRLEKLRLTTSDVVLQRSIELRLAVGQKPGTLNSRAEVKLARLVTETIGTSDVEAPRPRRGAPAVWGLIVINLVMFGVEILMGGATNDRTLDLLGALDPEAVIVRHEYWRLLTALFLHYGLLHILINLLALYLLGPELERLIGSFKFIMSYLISGLGSSLGVVLSRAFNLNHADQLVGASGCVMGVIGVSAGLLLRDRRTPLAGGRLRDIILIVAIQTAFDLWTPQVSLSAHLSGFATGLLLGAILASRP